MNGAHSLALGCFVLVSCASAPEPDQWPAHARAISDSVRLALAAYGDRFNAADRDSLLRFYADDSRWSWAADGRVGIPSSLMIRSRLDGLAAYPRWRLRYTNLSVVPLAPGLASVTAEYRMSFGGGAGKPLAYEGALTMFWMHRPAGWKVVGGHSSSLRDATR